MQYYIWYFIFVELYFVGILLVIILCILDKLLWVKKEVFIVFKKLLKYILFKLFVLIIFYNTSILYNF